MSVICLVEHDEDGMLDASARAAGFARHLAEQHGRSFSAVVFGAVTEPVIAGLAAQGATEVHVVEAPALDSFAPVAQARAISQVMAATETAAVVAAGTERGNEILAHLGAICDLAMVANCIDAAPRPDGSLQLHRYRWAGSLIEEANLVSATPLLTVAVDAVGVREAEVPTTVTVRPFSPVVSEEDLAVKVVETVPKSGGVALSDARVVVGGGRGMSGPEGFEVIEELAALLGGAVGVSRAVTSLGWRSHAEQVGQTGTRIAPDLYLVCGISGAIQHLAGCQAARHVIAVNTDADAPIMSRADYAVIGDVKVVLPALVDALKARRA